MINPFFKNKGPKKIEEILTQIKIQNYSEYGGINISDIKDLVNASSKDITFFEGPHTGKNYLTTEMINTIYKSKGNFLRLVFRSNSR